MKWSDANHIIVPGTISGKLGVAIAEKRTLANAKRGHERAGIDYKKTFSLLRAKVTNAPQTTRDPRQATHAERREVVAGYRQLLHKMNGTHFLTFMPGRFVQPETLAGNIKKFCCRLERKALGRNWYKIAGDRFWLIAFLEHPETTPHYHAFANFPPATAAMLHEAGGEIWNVLMPAGKLDMPGIKDEGKVINYITKDLHHKSAAEHVEIYGPILKS